MIRIDYFIGVQDVQFDECNNKKHFKKNQNK